MIRKNLLLWSLSIIACYGNAQVKDTTGTADFIPLIGVSYGLQLPGGELIKRFGLNSDVKTSLIFKDKHNLLYGLSGSFMFGNNVKEQSILDEFTTNNGNIINKEGRVADVLLFQRGFSAFANVGKQIPLIGPNKNSGIFLLGGIGFIQHKIRITDVANNVPQIDEEYVKGYDRLTNGIAFSESIGYRHIGDSRIANFYIAFEFIQGVTQNRRSYNFDTMSQDTKKRLDLLTGLRIGWTFPIYKRVPQEYYFY